MEQPINPTNIEEKINNEMFEQPVQFEPEKVTDFSTIFGNPTISDNIETTPVQNNNFVSFFGNFNSDLLNKLESESQMNVEPEFNDVVNNIENEINNEVVTEENNIFNETSIESQTDIPVQPVMPQIEELNFEDEIIPIKSFSLDDEDKFNNLNTQILSTSQTPVQIITPVEVPELQPIMPEQNIEKIGTINEMINKIRDVIDNIEQCGYKIDSDEMDLDNSYHISIVIEK